MKIVSILNQKGGVGKTTLTLNIGRALSLSGDVVLLVDTDPQMSLFQWRSQSEENAAVVVDAVHDPVKRMLKGFDPDMLDWVIIDSAAKITKDAIETIEVSDVILIPLTASSFDFWASKESIRYIEKRRLDAGGESPKVAFIFNNVRTGTRVLEKLMKKNNLPFPVFDTRAAIRQVYATSVDDGLTVFDTPDKLAKAEIMGITKELRSLASAN